MWSGLHTNLGVAMQLKCIVCSAPAEKLPGYKHKLYCSKECVNKGKWIKEANTVVSILAKILKSAMYRAKYKDIPFDLSIDTLVALWERQEGRCALTNFEFKLGSSSIKNSPKRNAPSLDRIVPHLGYTEDNVRLITYQANCAKSSYTDEDLLEFCRAVLDKGAA